MCVNSLEQLEQRFAQFDSMQKTEREAFEQDLVKAYPNESSLYRRAKILHMYGRCLYGGDMRKSSEVFRRSMATQLDILEHCKTLPESVTPISVSDDDLMQVAERVDLKSQHDEAFLLAKTLRWLGHSYQNIDAMAKKDNLQLFKRIYGLARSILENIPLKDANWEIGQLIYNTERFLHSLEYSEIDVRQFLKTLHIEMAPYLEKEGESLRGQVLRAQLHNISAVYLRDVQCADEQEEAQLLQQQYTEVVEARRIATGTPGFNPFLQILFLHNSANLALKCLDKKCPVQSLEEITASLNQMMHEMKEQQFDHCYYPGMCITAARAALKSQNHEEAKKILVLAERLCDSFKDSCQDDLIEIHQLQKDNAFC